MTVIADDLAVFLSSFNTARYLPRALDALLAQSVQPGSIHVVDDASTDESAAIIARYARDHAHVHPTYLTGNRGVIRNAGDWLESTRATHVYFASSDDLVLPGFFELSLAELRRYPRAGLCSALCQLIDLDGHRCGMLKTPVVLSSAGYVDSARTRALLLREDGWFAGPSTIYRRAALIEAGGFDPQLGSFTDGFAARVVAARHGACFIPKPLGCWRRGEPGFSDRTIANTAMALAVMDSVRTVVAARHADVFPPGYWQRWRGRWLFGVLRAGLRSPDPQRWMAVAQLPERGCAGRRAPGRVLGWMLRRKRLLRLSPWRRVCVLWGFMVLRGRDALPVLRRHVTWAAAWHPRWWTRWRQRAGIPGL